MRGLVILGSTGSIGRQTLDIVRRFPDRLRVIGLAAGSNLDVLRQQIEEFKPELGFFLGNERPVAVSSNTYRFVSMEEMVAHPAVDMVMVGTVGRVGLAPTLAALRTGKTVALANKEVVVMAGELLMAEAQRYRTTVLPVDSEPNAIWQCLRGENAEDISRVILTASGGPFRYRAPEELQKVTQQEALNHPTWRMGKKITIDSATLMNKGFEVIEAHYLFSLPYKQIEVVIHPESMVHSMVEFSDGSVKAVICPPDMRMPIQYALAYPHRWANPDIPRLDPVSVGRLSFEPLDPSRFPCFQVALEAGKAGGTYPAVLSAADEVAVEMFLFQQIAFLDIVKLVKAALDAHRPVRQPSLDDILAADAWAREFTANQVPT
ncbi:MAG: 1-deoxy-D-xylulose-5-phosphate reductoisomerase [Dehalococcoidia bacterium]|nr:1-deoxy-D-xylulose-5-phosphate reductoisomerase [Dehalococcoidia bacterium]